MYIEVSDCNMQEGSLRCDANVNLWVHGDDGQKIATPIVEIKNLNTFRGVEQAIEFEVARQIEDWERTHAKIGDVPKQTRGWDANRCATFAQRGKEEASDYRYFPDPDLTPVTVSDEFFAEVKAELCELPASPPGVIERTSACRTTTPTSSSRRGSLHALLRASHETLRRRQTSGQLAHAGCATRTQRSQPRHRRVSDSSGSAG